MEKVLTGGRSIKIEDIEQYSSYNPYDYTNDYGYTYGGTKEYNSSEHKYFIDVGGKDKNGNAEITGETEWTKDGITYKKGSVMARQTYYRYTPSSIDFTNSNALNLIFKTADNTSNNRATYWLASRCVNIDTSQCYFYTRTVYEGDVHARNLVTSVSRNGDRDSYGVVPVVSLKLNIQTTGKDGNNLWQLKTNTGIGKNTQQPNVYLVDKVEIGDYVNYDAKSGRVEPYTYTTDEKTGRSKYAGTEFSSNDNVQWRVLSKNEQTGEVELMAADNLPNQLGLAYATGYINADNILNDIGKLYGHGKGATGGRSINLTDIEQYSNYNPYDFTFDMNEGFSYEYGETKTYSNGNYFINIGNKIKSEDGQSTLDEITGGTEWTEEGITYKTGNVTARQTYYYCEATSNLSEEALNLIVKNAGDTNTFRSNYWLASSRCVALRPDDCWFVVQIVGEGFAPGRFHYE